LTAGNRSKPVRKNNKKTPTKSTENRCVQDVRASPGKSSDPAPANTLGFDPIDFFDGIGFSGEEIKRFNG
jgi:hypothetical protein